MLLSETVMIKWNRATCTYYKNLGYKFTKIYDEFEVKVEHLSYGSNVKVDVLCDYCLEDDIEKIIKKSYRGYLEGRKYVPKDCCGKCQGKKEREVNLVRFGVTSTALIPEIKEKQLKTTKERYGEENYAKTEECKIKRKETNLRKYGVENYTQTEEYKTKSEQTSLKNWGTKFPMQNKELQKRSQEAQIEKYGDLYVRTDEYRQKMREYNMEKHGVEHYTKTDEYKEKMKAYFMDTYGVTSPSQIPEVKEKVKQTNFEKYGAYYTATEEFKERVRETYLERYGVTHPMKLDSWKHNLTVKGLRTKYENGTNTASSQQKHIAFILGGELNYPIDRCYLDIAFLNEKIYIEYDGSGHDISVKYGKMTQEQFKMKEINRQYFLKKQGWRLIRIISLKDKLPTDDVLINIINQCKQYLNRGHSWITLDITREKVECSQFIKDYDYKSEPNIYLN